MFRGAGRCGVQSPTTCHAPKMCNSFCWKHGKAPLPQPPPPLTPLSLPSQPTTRPRETSARTQHTTMCDRWEDCASTRVRRWCWVHARREDSEGLACQEKTTKK